MHLVSFDLDGTLVSSSEFDGELYAQAIQDVLGVKPSSDWSRYRNVSDSGILDEILERISDIDERIRLGQEVRSTFVDRTYRLVANRPGLIKEVPGARALLESLQQSPNVRVCVATGGWAETASLKLRAIGLDPMRFAMATGSDAIKRTDIMRLAESRATNEQITRRTYFGDGVWDQRAAAELGYQFVAVGNRVDHPDAFFDLRDTERILAHLGVQGGNQAPGRFKARTGIDPW